VKPAGQGSQTGSDAPAAGPFRSRGWVALERFSAHGDKAMFRAATGRRHPTNGKKAMWLATLIHTFSVWRRYRSDRRTLAALDDRMLRDIGLYRTDIMAVASIGARAAELRR